MAKLDVYLRSIKQLGAQGAVLSSGQAVTLRFPTGDRHATQITSHEQIVALVREIAPPGAIDQLERSRAVKFDVDGNGARWSIQVTPRQGAWQVAIEPIETAPIPAAPPPPAPPTRLPTRAPTAAAADPTRMAVDERSDSRGRGPAGAAEPIEMAVDERGESRGRGPAGFAGGEGARPLLIERGQYGSVVATIATSGSLLLDQLTSGARAAYASDVYLSAGSPAFQRVGGELAATADRAPIDGDTLARELGLVAPNDARSAWAEGGIAVFAYGDGAGRVRVTLTSDHRGPGATLRLLPAEAPALSALGLASVAEWLTDRGLIVVAGPSGAGKTTTLAALVRALGESRRRVVAIEEPIELVHVSPWISQRAVGEHVPDIGAGVAAAMREGADAIVVGGVHTGAAAAAVLEALSGGHLVLTTLLAPRASVAVERMIDRLPAEQRELARGLCADTLLGTIGPVVTRAGRSFEVVGRGR